LRPASVVEKTFEGWPASLLDRPTQKRAQATSEDAQKISMVNFT
jgi:hypothetical protein